MKSAALQPQPLSNGTRMRDLHCLCLILSFLWEQMVKAYKYMSSIFLVSHSSNQQATDSARPPSKMDVNRLQEQYHYLKEKQKLHTHVVVFKTGMFWSNRESGEFLNSLLFFKRKAFTLREATFHLRFYGEISYAILKISRWGGPYVMRLLVFKMPQDSQWCL